MALRFDDVDLERDRWLVFDHQGGDGTAFEDLYRRYHSRLQRFCLKRVGDPYEAEEIAQEAFARAFRSLDSLQGDRRFYPWLSVIAARLCVDTHRRRARTSPSDSIDLGVVEGGQQQVIDDCDAALVRSALDRLTPSHQEVLLLRERDGWSYHRIAEHLGVTQGTVEARLFRARQALRREFEKLAGPEGTLAGLPIIGALIRRWGSARRINAWVCSLSPTAQVVGGAAAALAITVGIVGGGFGPVSGAPDGRRSAVGRADMALRLGTGGQLGAVAGGRTGPGGERDLGMSPGSTTQGGTAAKRFHPRSSVAPPAHAVDVTTAGQARNQAAGGEAVGVPGAATAAVAAGSAVGDVTDAAGNWQSVAIGRTKKIGGQQ